MRAITGDPVRAATATIRPAASLGWGWIAIVSLLLAYCLAQVAAIRADGPTVDEPVHLARGLSIWATGDFRLVTSHPPLANAWATWVWWRDPDIRLPLDGPEWREARWYAFGQRTLWEVGNPVWPLLVVGRIQIVLLGALALACLYRLGADVGGRWLALALALVAALDPNFRAHARLITTDAAVLTTLCLAGLVWWRAWPRWTGARAWSPVWLAACGLTLGLALASKHSALVFVVAVLGGAALAGAQDRRTPGRLAGVIGIALLTIWASYGFELRPLTADGPALPLGSYLREWSLLDRELRVPSYYLLGTITLGAGSPAYFVVALLTKTPLPVLLLAGAAGGWGLRALWRTSPAEWLRSPWIVLWGPPVIYFGVALISRFTIGYRHLFPVLPALWLGAAWAGWQVARQGWVPGPRVRRWVAGGGSALAAVALIGSVARVYPRDLTYFNESVAEADKRWILVDSNLDWGQALVEAVSAVRARGLTGVYVAYFGGAPANLRPLSDFPLPWQPWPEDWSPLAPTPGWYLISFTRLMGLDSQDEGPDRLAWFRNRVPDQVIGGAIGLYHVPEPGPVTVVVCQTAAPLNREAVLARFGQHVVLARVFETDCRQALVVPQGPTWYLIQGDPPDTTRQLLRQAGAVEVYAESNASRPEFALHVYGAEQGGDGLAPALHTPQRPQVFDGRLAFEGYRWVHPQRVAFALWRVVGPVDEGLSVFVHLLDADGRLIAGDDGLGVSSTILQAGDRVLRYITLAPGDRPTDASVRVGVYWLDREPSRLSLPDGSDGYTWPDAEGEGR